MSTIEWLYSKDGTEGETWNMIRARNLATGGVGHYCFKVDPACFNCYAETFQPRVRNPIRYAKQDQRLVEIFLDDERLTEPMRTKKGKIIFPCSMTDLFGDFVHDEWIDKVYAVMALSPQHTFKLLTKRADRRRAWMEAWPNGAGRRHRVFHEAHALLNKLAKKGEAWSSHDPEFARAQKALEVWPLPNVHEGISAGTQETLNSRGFDLEKTPAAKRWLSAEPILEDLDLTVALEFLDGVVVGGESGARARPTVIGHIRRVVRQCQLARKPVFVKQLGRYPINREGASHKITDLKGAVQSDMPEDLRVRENF